MIIRHISSFAEIRRLLFESEIKLHIKMYGHLLCGVFCLIQRNKESVVIDCSSFYL